MVAIVQVNVSQTVAPTPSFLQEQGALISQGGTTTAPGSYSLLTAPASLTPLLAAPLALTSLAWAATSGGTVTGTTAVAHGIAVGDQFPTTIAGAIPAGYNGTYMATATGASTFSYQLAANPGAETTPGTYTPRSSAELSAMTGTFFGQGSQQGVYVLELGAGEPAAGVAALTAFITANPGFFYSYLVPRSWDGVASFLAFLAGFESTTAKTYFHVTTTLATYTAYTALMKCVIATIEAPATGVWAANVLTALAFASGQATATTTTAHGIIPGQWFTIAGCVPVGYNGTFQALPGTTGTTLIYAPAANPGAETTLGTVLASAFAQAAIPTTEFSAAAGYFVTLNYNPSTVNKVTPYAFSFVFGVTPFPVRGNGALLAILKAANINVIGTGSEGGISNTMLLWGTTMDGNDFTFWYSIDWVQINCDLNVANEIINGSNNPQNPLDFNQDGINRLQLRTSRTMASAITFGLATGTLMMTDYDGPTLAQQIEDGTFTGMLDVNAVPFIPYLTASPGDYKIGKYAGLSVIYTPARGFTQVIINVNVTQFVVQ